jgi:hypothetical protein
MRELTGQQYPRLRMPDAAGIGFEKRIAAMDDELGAAVGRDGLGEHVGRAAFEPPQAVDEGLQRRRWAELAVDHANPMIESGRLPEAWVPELHASLPLRRFGETTRRDAWWLQSAAVFFGLSAFIVYSTWAAFQNEFFEFGPYLSPMYSPLLFGSSPHAWIGGPDVPTWWPGILPYSAAFLILWAPGGFRFTCYYYRGAYYKAFWADPPACGVGEPRTKYRGERWFPLVFQNVHRYFLYLAIGFLFILSYDVWVALWFPAAGGGTEFGIGIGSLVLVLNVVLLGGYTLGCHSFRHLAGGVLDVMSRKPARRTAYVCSSALNRGHMKWAWASLIWVAFSDVYVHMCAMGMWSDLRIL